MKRLKITVKENFNQAPQPTGRRPPAGMKNNTPDNSLHIYLIQPYLRTIITTLIWHKSNNGENYYNYSSPPSQHNTSAAGASVYTSYFQLNCVSLIMFFSPAAIKEDRNNLEFHHQTKLFSVFLLRNNLK